MEADAALLGSSVPKATSEPGFEEKGSFHRIFLRAETPAQGCREGTLRGRRRKEQQGLPGHGIAAQLQIKQHPGTAREKGCLSTALPPDPQP